MMDNERYGQINTSQDTTIWRWAESKLRQPQDANETNSSYLATPIQKKLQHNCPSRNTSTASKGDMIPTFPWAWTSMEREISKKGGERSWFSRLCGKMRRLCHCRWHGCWADFGTKVHIRMLQGVESGKSGSVKMVVMVAFLWSLNAMNPDWLRNNQWGRCGSRAASGETAVRPKTIL